MARTPPGMTIAEAITELEAAAGLWDIMAASSTGGPLSEGQRERKRRQAEAVRVLVADARLRMDDGK